MKKCFITGQAYCRESNQLIGESRKEEVDVNSPMFEDCNTENDFKEKFESFWNDLNPYSKEIVKAEKIELIQF